MPDDRFYDAINVFKYSPTGTGGRSPGGDPGYQATMSALVRTAIDKLWNYLTRDQIKFNSVLPWDSKSVELGASDESSLWLNPELAPDKVFFTDPLNQSRLAAVSLTMAHEAIHAASGFKHDLTEEVVCRVVEMLYLQDLTLGLRYTSKVAGAVCFAHLLPIDPRTTFVVSQHTTQLAWFQAGQVVDFVLLNSKRYVGMLTPDWILKSKTWWGGLKNRKPETKGFYLNALAPKAHRTLAYSSTILEILESMATNAEWLTCGSEEKELKLALSSALYSNDTIKRIKAVQKKLGISLGAK
jgi:hypothetical protein